MLELSFTQLILLTVESKVISTVLEKDDIEYWNLIINKTLFELCHLTKVAEKKYREYSFANIMA